jgi:DNA-binding transcriptional regulator GbsR (MarR family)
MRANPWYWRVASERFVQYKLNIMNQVATSTLGVSELEREVIELFIRMADVLSLPRSVGEIYGLLFISANPLCLDDCRIRLNISKGSTSQGLKILRSFGAIRTVYMPGDRKDYYVAETSVRKIASGFAGEQIQPHVLSGKERISRIRELLDANESGDQEDLSEKIDLLDNWQKRAGKTLPLILKLIGS